MKAIVYTKYGPPDVLKLKEIEKPLPKDDEVLIKVKAASINSWDWDRLTGKPLEYRLISGIFKPKLIVIGCDVAGEVEAAGRNVKKFKPGDDVFGDLCDCGWGGFAEYVCAHEKALIHKPETMTFEQAAAVPQGAVLAMQGLRGLKSIQPGHRVLINGACGAVGTIAIQLAKLYGAEVTGVDSAAKLDAMRSLGADHVIDYTKEDFIQKGIKYDLIIDNVAGHSILDYNRSLNAEGVFYMVGGASSLIWSILFTGTLMSMFGNKKMRLLAHKPNKDLDYFVELFEAGKIKPVIDRCYSLKDVPEAFRYFGEGTFKGKIVINKFDA